MPMQPTGKEFDSLQLHCNEKRNFQILVPNSFQNEFLNAVLSPTNNRLLFAA